MSKFAENGDRHPIFQHVSAAADSLRETRKAWPGLSLYERFEEVVVVVLTGLIGLVIVAAVINLCFRVVLLVIFGLLDPAEHSVFQAVFGMIFTGDCQEFRVRAAIVDPMEVLDGTTQSTPYP
jgi:hypothetical protein